MIEAVASKTALRVALRRAAHQLYDAKPLVLDDPFAVKLLGGRYAEELRRTPQPSRGGKPRPHSAGLRAHLVARSRYAEDLLAKAVAGGVRQYVLLGAGLDTFAWRNPWPELRVFEVDHPATQAWKRDLAQAAGLGKPAGLTYVPMDFERDSLTDRLRQAGHDAAQPSFFAWLGVVPYLTLEAFRGTLAYVAAQPGGSGLVFDYGQPREALPHEEQLARDSLAARVEQAGEPFRLFLTPVEVARELAAFSSIEDLGAPEINRRYFAARTDGLRMLGSAGRMVSASL